MLQERRAVLFDMDGVIVHTMPDHFRAWQEILRSIGIQVDKLEIYAREGEPGMVTLSELLAKYGKQLPLEEKQHLVQQKESLFKKIASPSLFSGVEDLIQEIKKRGYRLALVTGTSQNEVDSILPARLSSLFEVIITGDRVRRGKPAPDPYLAALEKLNIRPHEALVIENAPYGIQAAKGAGLLCIAVTTSLPREYLQQADVILDSVQEVRELLFGQAAKDEKTTSGPDIADKDRSKIGKA
ncbi:MAG: HAD family phosphatase [bacterium]